MKADAKHFLRNLQSKQSMFGKEDHLQAFRVTENSFFHDTIDV